MPGQPLRLRNEQQQAEYFFCGYDAANERVRMERVESVVMGMVGRVAVILVDSNRRSEGNSRVQTRLHSMMGAAAGSSVAGLGPASDPWALGSRPVATGK